MLNGQTELRLISSDPKSRYVHLIESYEAVKGFAGYLARLACQGMPPKILP